MNIRSFYEFAGFRLDPYKLRLVRDGSIVPLTPKAVETLLVLVQNRTRTIEREELLNAVWAETFVEDGNLSVTVSMLRKALGEKDNHTKFIETVPRIGYRFVADVREIDEEI